MAEILLAARDLPTGYRRGDPIIAMPDGWSWGREEGLPKFVVLKIPGLSVAKARERLAPLFEDAQPGDPEFNAPDPKDRRILRARRRWAVFIDELPRSVINEFRDTGEYTATPAQVRNYIRGLRWNRTTGDREDTGELEFGDV